MSAPDKPPGPRRLDLRPARADEAPDLAAIARAAKAHWGYDEAMLDAWRSDLSASPGGIAAGLVWVAEAEGKVAGFVELALTPMAARLEGLWVHPWSMRCGVGRALLDRARSLACRAGHPALDIDADPHAEAFYRAMGAERRGVISAPLPGQPARVRPQLRIATGLGHRDLGTRHD